MKQGKSALARTLALSLNSLPQKRGSHKAPDLPLKRQRRMRKDEQLAQLVAAQQAELSHLDSLKMSLITKMQKEEFLLHILAKEHEDLKAKVGKIDDEVAVLQEQTAAVPQHYANEYELEKQRMLLQHETRTNDLKEETSTAIEKIIQKEVEASKRERDVAAKQVDEIESQIKNAQSELTTTLIKLKESHSKKLHELRSKMDESVASLKQTISQIDESMAEKTKEVEALTTRLNSARTTAERYTRIRQQLEGKYSGKNEEIDVLRATIATKKKQIADIKRLTEQETADTAMLKSETVVNEARIYEQEAERRVLHNRLQELKGNIRVFCRIRAVNSSDTLSEIELNGESINDEANQELTLFKTTTPLPITRSPSKARDAYYFQFDRVFLMVESNEDIFEEIAQLVQSSLDGYNVCVFAYGQTGSGKTFTMSHAENGMIPLSVQKIFQNVHFLEKHGWKYTITGQFIEIYNETIVDLLDPNTTRTREIKHDGNNTTVTNTKVVEIKSEQHAHKLLTVAEKSRSTGFTSANERSSRSHSIFTLRIMGEKDGERREGTVNLIDLAGSERLTTSQTKGDRLRETQAINKSLSSLGDVICALGQGGHVPYRNSKLTYLLKNSLGGDSKTLMFVNISPLLKNFNETVNSLRFASKVNQTKQKGKWETPFR